MPVYRTGVGVYAIQMLGRGGTGAAFEQAGYINHTGEGQRVVRPLSDLEGQLRAIIQRPDEVIADTALVGSAAIVFTGPAAVLTTAIPLSGSSAIVFTGPAANLTTAIQFAGASAIVFAGPNAVLTTAIALAGSSAVVFVGPGAVLSTAIALSGTSAIVFAGPAANLATIIALAGSSAIVFVGGAALLATGSARRFAILDAAANATVVNHTLMDDLKERYGEERGRFVYFAMEREGKGPFAPGNKYDATDRAPQPLVIKRSVRPIGPAPKPVPRWDDTGLRGFADQVGRALTKEPPRRQ